MTDPRAEVEALPVERIEGDGPIGDHDADLGFADYGTVEVVSRAAVLTILARPAPPSERNCCPDLSEDEYQQVHPKQTAPPSEGLDEHRRQSASGEHLFDEACLYCRPAPPSEGLSDDEIARARQIAATAPDTEVGRLIVRLVALAARPAPPSEGPDVELERLHRIEHAARDVDGLWSESRTLIHWQVEAGEALRDLRAALTPADPSAAKEADRE